MSFTKKLAAFAVFTAVASTATFAPAHAGVFAPTTAAGADISKRAANVENVGFRRGYHRRGFGFKRGFRSRRHGFHRKLHRRFYGNRFGYRRGFRDRGYGHRYYRHDRRFYKHRRYY